MPLIASWEETAKHYERLYLASAEECLVLESENLELKKRLARAEKENREAFKAGCMQGVGWAYTDCCITLDEGGDPRQTDMATVHPRAAIDLGTEYEKGDG